MTGGDSFVSRGDAPLRSLVRPYILRRLKSDKRVIADLPDKTEVKAYCALSRLQASLYQQAVDALATQIQTLDGSWLTTFSRRTLPSSSSRSMTQKSARPRVAMSAMRESVSS